MQQAREQEGSGRPVPVDLPAGSRPDGRLPARAGVRPARLRRWDALIRPALPRGVEAGISVVLLAALAYADYWAGPHIDLAVFYFIPIFIAAWSTGPRLGMLLAVAAVLSSHLTEHELIQAPEVTRLHVLYQDFAHALMFIPAAWFTSLVKRQGDRLAAEHARLLEAQARLRADMEAAQRVQQSLMGQSLPEIPAVGMALRYRSAREVGGDLVDVRRRGVRVGICVADVSGKGAQAALMAVAVKGWLDYVPGRFVSPAEVADHLNRRVSEVVPTEMFVTFTYLVLNTTTGEARCVIAGHEPPLLLRPGGSAPTSLGPTGPALGLIPGVPFEEISFTMEEGDLLLCYTDGLTTARRADGSRPGIEPTLDYLEAVLPADLNALVDDLLASVVPPGGVPEDDVAILAVQRRGD
jgi:serine phosphatase RsbU (regulator of sigma subunit)